jgi:hypothetical protein
VVHHLGAFAESAVCAFHFWEDFQGRSKTGFPVVVFFIRAHHACRERREHQERRALVVETTEASLVCHGTVRSCSSFNEHSKNRLDKEPTDDAISAREAQQSLDHLWPEVSCDLGQRGSTVIGPPVA